MQGKAHFHHVARTEYLRRCGVADKPTSVAIAVSASAPRARQGLNLNLPNCRASPLPVVNHIVQGVHLSAEGWTQNVEGVDDLGQIRTNIIIRDVLGWREISATESQGMIALCLSWCPVSQLAATLHNLPLCDLEQRTQPKDCFIKSVGPQSSQGHGLLEIDEEVWVTRNPGRCVSV